ncbi:hypothetical protein VCHENC02_4558A, partial [Vibrio harveyi]
MDLRLSRTSANCTPRNQICNILTCDHIK